jgi:uncharacterized membrane protein
MSLKILVTAYVVTLVVLLAIDAVWLGTMAVRLYKPVMGDMLAGEFRPVPAILFYLVYVAGLTFLAVRPALLDGRLATALVNGAVTGFTAYATYDLTNQATLKSWSSLLTVADLAWGTLLSAIAASAGFWIARRFSGSSGGR